MPRPPARARVLDTMRVAAELALPTIAGGVIKRRPDVLAAAEKLNVDRPAIRLMQRLRGRHGDGLLRLRVPGRSIALVMSPEDVGRVLEDSPEPFTPANYEKRAALSHFQPHGVLISQGGPRGERREFNEDVLDTQRPLHQLSADIVKKVTAECDRLITETEAAGELTWDAFNEAWWRIVRRIVLGDAAATDDRLTELLGTLRKRANWAYAAPKANRERDRFSRRLAEHLDRAEPGSLAKLIAEASAGQDTAPYGQVPHWLFAFDAAGMATLRTLALLATHPEQAEGARSEVAERDLSEPQHLPYLRACVLDTVRLWPTTPLLLRDGSTATDWSGVTMPAGTTYLIYAPFFHRDSRTLPYADAFTPEIWLDGRAEANPALVPFSAGPGQCPGQNLVLLVTTTVLAHLLRAKSFHLAPGKPIDPRKPLPATVDNFTLRFSVV